MSKIDKYVCRNPSCRMFFLRRRNEKSLWRRNYCSKDCANQYTKKFAKGLL